MKPMLFNTAMVRAILDGRKTVTRRVVKPRHGGRLEVHDDLFGTPCLSERCGNLCRGLKPPFQSGDILYVRETWYYEEHMHDATKDEPDLPSGRYSHRYIFKAAQPDYPVNVGVGRQGWRPSIHMPKEAARLFLRVMDVRVERLQDISSCDIEREGIDLTDLQGLGCITREEYVYAFQSLWVSTLKPADLASYGWDANPWVWVIEFEKISRGEVEDSDK